MRRSRVPVAIQVTGLYLAFAVTWIVLSDRLVDALVTESGGEGRWQTAKGLVFVVVSGGVLYLLARHYVRRVEATATRLAQAYDETLAGWASALDIRDRSTGSTPRG